MKRAGRMRVLVAISLVMFWSAACGSAADGPQGGAYTDHGESSDLEPVGSVGGGKGDAVSATFDANFIVTDAFFENGTAMDGQEVQAFLSDTPYGRSTWLANATVDGRPASEAIVAAAREHSINPMVLLVRFQVEGSHISKSSHPGASSANRALGCGCFDGQACQSKYLGLGKQLDCAASTLRQRYRGSVDGSWHWQKGKTTRAEDGVAVTPVNHATAAFYAYTPWVLRGRGGNWLVWNITKKFLDHTPSAAVGGGSDDATDTPGDDTTPPLPVERPERPWVGTPCTSPDDCDFEHNGSLGFCYDDTDPTTGETRGFCSLVCEGYCPDRDGEAVTFCIEADVGGVGVCASKSESRNSFCADIPGTTPQDLPRWVGSSGVPNAVDSVCDFPR